MCYEKVKVSEIFQSLEVDSGESVALLNLNGELVQINEQFQSEIQIKTMDNIKSLFDETAVEVWDEFIQIAKSVGRASFYMPIRDQMNKWKTVEIRLTYHEATNQMMAQFNPLLLSVQNELERSHSKAFLKSSHMMFLMDQEETIQDVNEMSATFFDVSREFLIGKKLNELFYLIPGLHCDYKKYFNEAVENGSAKFFNQFESSNGDVRHLQIITFYDADTHMYLMRIEDHTEKVILEEQLAQKASLSSLGQLAASIAHEIRNPMTALKGFTQLLRVTATEESKKYLNVIDDEIIRMESILSEMLILSKPSTNKKEILSLPKLLSSIISVIRPKAILEGITIIEDDNTLQEEFIFGNEAKLKQAILNLLKNSLEAMSWGGALTVRIEKADNGKLLLSIGDTGKGLDVNQINQLFTPYFTTRNKGTGLGLPFVLKTIEDHGGTISVESEVNIGTNFILSFLPAVENVYSGIVDEKVLSGSGRHY